MKSKYPKKNLKRKNGMTHDDFLKIINHRAERLARRKVDKVGKELREVVASVFGIGSDTGFAPDGVVVWDTLLDHIELRILACLTDRYAAAILHRLLKRQPEPDWRVSYLESEQ